MPLYGVYGSHTIDGCPINNPENRRLTIQSGSRLKEAADAAGVKILAQYHSGLEHTWLWVFEADDAQTVENLLIMGGAAKFNACKIVPLTTFDDLLNKLKTIEGP